MASRCTSMRPSSTSIPAGAGSSSLAPSTRATAQRTLRVVETARSSSSASPVCRPRRRSRPARRPRQPKGAGSRSTGSSSAAPTCSRDGLAVYDRRWLRTRRVIVVTPAALGDRSLVSGSTVAGDRPARPARQLRDRRDRLSAVRDAGSRARGSCRHRHPRRPRPRSRPPPRRRHRPPTPGATPTPTADADRPPTPDGAARRPTASPSPAWSTIAAARAAAIGDGRHGPWRRDRRGGSPRHAGPARDRRCDRRHRRAAARRRRRHPPAGRIVDVRGALADPYGQLEVRPAAAGFAVEGGGSLPVPPRCSRSAGLGESTEGRLVRTTGTVVEQADARRPAATSRSRSSAPAATAFKVMADASSGVTATSIQLDARRIGSPGSSGQRATRKGALDGYRVWLRDPADLCWSRRRPRRHPPRHPPVRRRGPRRSHRPSRPRPRRSVVSVAAALAIERPRRRDRGRRHRRREPPRCVRPADRRRGCDGGHRDPAAQGHTGARCRRPGPRRGRVGAAYGAPRLRATALETLGTRAGSGSDARARRARRAPTPGGWSPWPAAWTASRKLGERWRAEVVVGTPRVVVVGQPGAGIPVASIVEGRAIEVTASSAPAYPTRVGQARVAAATLGRPMSVLAGAAAASGTGSAGQGGDTAGSGGATGDGAGDGGSSGTARRRCHPARPRCRPRRPRRWPSARPSASVASSWSCDGDGLHASTTARRSAGSC